METVLWQVRRTPQDKWDTISNHSVAISFYNLGYEVCSLGRIDIWEKNSVSSSDRQRNTQEIRELPAENEVGAHRESASSN